MRRGWGDGVEKEEEEEAAEEEEEEEETASLRDMSKRRELAALQITAEATA